MKRFLLLTVTLMILMSNFGIAESDTVWVKKIGSEVLQVKFNPDGEKIYVGGANYKPFIVSTLTGETIKEFEQSFVSVTAMDLSKDGEWLIIGGGNRNVELINTKNESIKNLIIPQEINQLYENMIIYSASISADNNHCCIVTVGSNKQDFREGHIIIWDLKTQTYLNNIDVGFAKRARYSPTENILAVCYDAVDVDCPVELYNTDTYQKIKTLGYHSSNTQDISFSPDGSLLASCGWDGIIKIWDVEQKKLMKDFLFHSPNDYLLSVSFSSDNKLIFVGGGNIDRWAIKVYDRISYEEKHIYLINYLTITSEGPIDIDAKQIQQKNYIITGTSRGLILLNTDWITNVTTENAISKKIINIPNPIKNSTEIVIPILRNGYYDITIFDNNSEKLDVIHNGFLESGKHSFIWDATKYANGTYFCIVNGQNYSDTLKILIQR